MEKDLLKLDNEQCDDDFEKMFQGFLDDELSSDDSDTDDENTNDGETNDDEDHAPRFGGERHYMPEITKVKILTPMKKTLMKRLRPTMRRRTTPSASEANATTSRR